MALEKFIQTTGKKTIDTLYKAKKPLNKAQNTLDTINEIDLCNIINYFLNKAVPPGSQAEEQFAKLKAEVKKINDKINELEESKTYTQLSDARSKQVEILSIINSFQVPEFVIKLIPQGGELIKQLKGTANNINDITTAGDIGKVLNTLSELKTTLQQIENMTSPADLVNITRAGQQIQKLQEVLNPAQLIPTLNALVNSVEGAGRVLNLINNNLRKLANLVQSLSRIISILKKALLVIKNIPIPARFVLVSTINRLQDIARNLDKKLDKAESSLKELNEFLQSISKTVNDVTQLVNVIIAALQKLLEKLKTCEKTKNLPVVRKTETLIVNLTKTKEEIIASVTTPDPKAVVYKGFKLTILTEEVTDEGITLRRRYGVATNSQGIVKAQTDLTYATLDEIIYSELRLQINRFNLEIAENTNPTEEASLEEELGLPSEQEQLADIAASEAEVATIIKSIPAEEKAIKERNKRDKRKIKRASRLIRFLKKNGKAKPQIKTSVLRKYDGFDDQDFEDAWRQAGY
jgi:ABC-type transporter Mla subunit MlaD